MIILGKNKVDERYNIDDNGIITDLQGNIQKTSNTNNRIRFKYQLTYRILMWTRYGWRDGRIWHIHHIDGNPLNNNINNLIFLTKAEHLKLHKKGKQRSYNIKKKISENHSHYWKNKHLSEEHKLKISKNNVKYWKNKHLSEETKKKLSESHKGRIISEETRKKLSEAQKRRWTNYHNSHK